MFTNEIKSVSTKLYTATRLPISTLSNEEWNICHHEYDEDDSCTLYFEYNELIDYNGNMPSSAMIKKFQSMGYNMDYVASI